jgi:hypothetical protein
MQKIKTSLVTAGCLFFIQFAHGAIVEIEGETLNCDVKSFSHLKCEGKGKTTLVILEDNEAVAFEQDSKGMVKAKRVSRISENKKILFHSDETSAKTKDTLVTRIMTANYIAGLNTDMPEMQEFAKKAKEYLKGDGRVDRHVKVNYNKKTYECEGGFGPEVFQTGNERRFEKNLKCQFYACQGKDGEQVIAHIPLFNDGNGDSNLVIMKNGTAQYIDNGFTVDDGSDVLVETELVSRPLALESRLPVDPDFLIPNGYKGDKKTFLYMTNANKDDYLVHAQKLCSFNSDLKKLFQEQKKIGDKLSEISEQEKLIELVTAVDGKLRSIYVDKTKGLRAGCLYNEKIYETSEDNSFAKKIEKLVGPGQVTSYVDEKDLKEVYNSVKYIPGAGPASKAGAEARAHMISKNLEKLGIQHQKIWIKGNLDQSWNYNVANTIVVKTNDGDYVRFVIDPGISSEAIPEAQWTQKLVRNNKNPVLKTTYPIAENTATLHRTMVAYSSPDMYGMEFELLTEKEKTDRAYKDFKEEIAKTGAGQYE